MPTKRPPRETSELAKYIVDVTVGAQEKIEPPKKNPHAQALAKLEQVKAATLARKRSRKRSVAR